MQKYSLRKRIFATLLGVLLLITDCLPLYATTLATCTKEPGLCALLAGTRPALSTPGAANPFALAGRALTSKATGATIAVGGAAIALGYLTTQDMQNLRDRASSSAPLRYGSYYAYVYGVQNILSSACSYTLAPFSNPFNGQVGTKIDFVAINQSQSEYTFVPPTSSAACNPVGSPLPPNLGDAINGLPDSAILAAAAAAAALAAQNAAANKDRTAAAIAASAAAAASDLISQDPNASQADKDAAAAAAAAAAGAAEDAADPTVAPANPQAPSFAFSRTNFLAYAASSQGFGNKFPFGMFAPLPAGSAMACPTFTSWGKTVELCFIKDIIMLIKYIVWVRFAIYSFVNL